MLQVALPVARFSVRVCNKQDIRLFVPPFGCAGVS